MNLHPLPRYNSLMRRESRPRPCPLCATLLLVVACVTPIRAGDQRQWGRAGSRNMTSDETGLPEDFDPATGKNVKWVAPLGSQCYATPIVAGGRVLIGTNNANPRDPRHVGDRGVLLCLNEADGKLLWQLVVPKSSEDYGDPWLDWRLVGFASPPSVEGDRAYTLTNRGEVVCLDMNGLADGNAGPFTDEAKHMTAGAATRPSLPLLTPAANDADIVWVCDLVKALAVRTHDEVQGSVLIHGDLLYVNTCNGVDRSHKLIPSPDAPAMAVIDKRTGKLVAHDALRLGPTTFHVGWSSPALGVINGQPRVFLGGGDGICYGFDPPALSGEPTSAQPSLLKDAWRFDPDPSAPKADVHKWVGNRREGPSVIMGMPVIDGGRLYLTAGGDPWWGKQQAWLKCVDPSGSGDVTKSAEVWSYAFPRETCSTPAVYDGMVFVTDVGGTVHCVDAATGKGLWTHKAVGDFWASPLVADGKVYAGTRRGQFVVLAAAREKRLLAKVDVDDPVNGTATAANGVLYVATMKNLFALSRGSK